MEEFLKGIPPEIFTGGGFASLVFLSVWLIFTGRLVPRSTHEETRSDRDAWRTAFETSEQARQKQAEQLDDLLESAKATERLMTAIQQSTTARRAGGR